MRSGAWLTRARARLIAVALLTAFALGALFLIATSDGRNDRFGHPLGTDFSNVYAAGTYLLAGEPPFFLALAGLLALMPYWLSLLVW